MCGYKWNNGCLQVGSQNECLCRSHAVSQGRACWSCGLNKVKSSGGRCHIGGSISMVVVACVWVSGGGLNTRWNNISNPYLLFCFLHIETVWIVFLDVRLPHSCLKMNVPQRVNLTSMMSLIAAKCHQIPVTLTLMTWMNVSDPLLEVRKNIHFYLEIALMNQ